MASLLDPRQTNIMNRGPVANQAVNQIFHEKVVINQSVSGELDPPPMFPAITLSRQTHRTKTAPA
jgi:hypothetical protein